MRYFVLGGQVVAHLGKILCRACLARDLEWKTLYHLLPFFRIILLINHSELSPSSNIPVSNYGHFCTLAKSLYIGFPFLFFSLLGFFITITIQLSALFQKLQSALTMDTFTQSQELCTSTYDFFLILTETIHRCVKLFHSRKHVLNPY